MKKERKVKESIASLVTLFKDKLYRYHSLSEELHYLEEFDDSYSTPTEVFEGDDSLLGQIIELENHILTYFGLRIEVAAFSDILQQFGWKETVKDKDIKELLKDLRNTAEAYLSAPKKDAITVLTEGKEALQTAQNVLPHIDIDLHKYNIFLYEVLFYSKDYDVAIIFSEMQRGNTIPNDLVKEMDTDLLFNEELIDRIAPVGLQYWDEFIVCEKNARDTTDQKTIEQIDAVFFVVNEIELPSRIISVDTCYLSAIKCIPSKRPYAYVIMVTEGGKDRIEVAVTMSFAEVIELLKRATNYTTASLVRSMLLEQSDPNNSIDEYLLIREWYDTYLCCQGCDTQITLSDLEDDDEEMIENRHVYQTVGFFDYLTKE